MDLSPTDNFDSRSIVHLIANKLVTVGVLQREKLDALFKKHPNFKKIMKKSNRYVFDIGRKSLETTLKESHKEVTRQSCVSLLASHYECSSDLEYKEIIRITSPSISLVQIDNQDAPNISKNQKLYYIRQKDRNIRKKFMPLVDEVVIIEKKPFI